MEQQYANAKSKTEQKELLLEIEEFENEHKHSETLREAEGFAYIVEAAIADTQIKVYQVQMKMKLPYIERVDRYNQQSRENEEILEQFGPNRSAKPPIIKLSKFNGDQEEFPEFWALYESLVHNCAELTTIEKIVLLKESLRGPAETAVRGIKSIPANYDWMVETLKKPFSNQPTNSAKIVQRLFELPHANKKADSCQRCFDSITTLVHQMVSAGHDIRQTCEPTWTETIIKKFPYEIVKDILVKNQEVGTMTIQDLLDVLEKEISAKAYVELRLGYEKLTLPNHRQENLPGTFYCVFCRRSNQPSAACRTVTSQNKRRDIVKQKHLCWKCFSSEHSSKDCAKSNCSSCGRTHHFSLCIATSDKSFIPSALINRAPLGSNQKMGILLITYQIELLPVQTTDLLLRVTMAGEIIFSTTIANVSFLAQTDRVQTTN
ncbi:hypothetical protein OESDEN_10511, partial [Oesophagostomum dentatum]